MSYLIRSILSDVVMIAVSYVMKKNMHVGRSQKGRSYLSYVTRGEQEGGGLESHPDTTEAGQAGPPWKRDIFSLAAT
jgi:hypothetical protein